LQNHSTTTKTDEIIRCYLKPQNNKNNFNLLSQAVEPALNCARGSNRNRSLTRRKQNRQT
jgi:hypothetical protein